MLEAVVGPIAVAWGAASPRASTRDEVTMIFGPLADEGASLVFGTVAASVD